MSDCDQLASLKQQTSSNDDAEAQQAKKKLDALVEAISENPERSATVYSECSALAEELDIPAPGGHKP